MKQLRSNELDAILEKEKEKQKEIEKQRVAGAKGEILSIKMGKASDFFEDPKGDPEALTLEFTIATPDGYTIRKSGKVSLHPLSLLSKMIQALGHNPYVGDEVPLRFDGQFWRLNV